MSGHSNNSPTNIFDKFTKSNAQKNKSIGQLSNSSISGFGIVGDVKLFTSTASLSMPSGLSDQPDVRMQENVQVRESRRPSVISNDSTSSLSSLKMILSKSFSRSSDETEPPHRSADDKLKKKGSKLSKLAKDVSSKSRKNSKNNSDSGLPNGPRSPGSLDVPSPMEDSTHDALYIGNLLKELISTEKSYVRDLREIEQGYRVPMSNDINFSKEDLHAVFCNIKSIYSFNRKLLKLLLKQQDDAEKICQVFIDNKVGFNIYTNYCTNYQRSISTLEQYKGIPEREKFIKDCQRLVKHPLPLHTYLFKPVQRILKYHLILKNLSEHWHASSSSSENVVSNAYKCMMEVAENINDVKKKQDEQLKLNQLLNSIQGLDGVKVSSLGGLVIKGKLFSLGAREEMMVFLFEKGILITKKRKDCSLVFRMIIMCSSLTLVEIIPREPFAFQVMGYDFPKNQCTLQARSLEEKRVWCREIKTIILDSIKADVPEKARLLLMKPGLCQDDEDVSKKQKVFRKMSANLEYLPVSGGSPKTSTPLQPFLRSKLRKTAFAKFTSEKKSKSKSRIGKRRSRSLENLNVIVSSFHNCSVDVTPREVKKIPFVEDDAVVARDRSFVERTPDEESGFWSNSNPVDPAASPKKSCSRASSFKRAVIEHNLCDDKPRISYSRSLSATYSSDSGEAEEEDFNSFATEGLAESLSQHEEVLSFEGNESSPDVANEFIPDFRCPIQRNDSLITISSGMSFNDHTSFESLVLTPQNSFRDNLTSIDTGYLGENEINQYYSCAKENGVQNSSTDSPLQSNFYEETKPAKTNRDSNFYENLPVEFVSKETVGERGATPDENNVDGAVKTSKIDLDVRQLLRMKSKQLNREQRCRTSLLKRKSAFCKQMKNFIPRRSVSYMEVDEVRNTSLPMVFKSPVSEEIGMQLQDGKLCLSEDSLPISPPIDDEEMINIILTVAAEESRVAAPELKDGKDREEDFDDRKDLRDNLCSDVPSAQSSGVMALLELIASCQDLSEEFNDSFNKIKLREDSHPENDIPSQDVVATGLPNDPDESEESQLPILKEEVYGNHLLRNKNHNYVFRLARAYSNRFKKLSGTNQDSNSTKASCPDTKFDVYSRPQSGDSKSSDPDIGEADKRGIVKQRILQFQHNIS